MHVEKGKTYRDEYGNRVGPLTGDSFKWVEGKSYGVEAEWSNDGRVAMRGPEGYGDLIAEWTNGPVRTVTRTVTEIVEGQYGRIRVCSHLPNAVLVGFTDGSGDWDYTSLTASELKAAAAVLLELAGALDSE